MKRLLIYSGFALMLAGCASVPPVYKSPANYENVTTTTRSHLFNGFETEFTRSRNIQIIPAVDNEKVKYLLFRMGSSTPIREGYDLPGSCVTGDQFGNLIAALDSMVYAFGIDRRGKLLKYEFTSGITRLVLVGNEYRKVTTNNLIISFSLSRSEFTCLVGEDYNYPRLIMTTRDELEKFRETIIQAIQVLK